jgi:hypothetical protein
MNKSLLVLSGVAISALLAGCASSSFLEEQAKLIEYEACLGKQELLQQEVLKLVTKDGIDWEQAAETIFSTGEPDPKLGLITSLETMMKQCAKYRP